MMLPFDFPPTTRNSPSPKWDDRNFIVGDKTTPVLEYSENLAGWSDDLAVIHEEAIGGEHPIDIASRSDALAQVKKYMPSDKAVIMEIGCSSGYFIRDMVKSFPEAVIIGADVVKEPLYRFAGNFPGIPLLCFDLLQCPLPDQSVDVLVMLNVLEHIEDDLGALQKACDLLKPSGALIIEVPAGPKFYDAYDKEDRHFRRYSPAELRLKLTAAGFKIDRLSYLGVVLFPAFAAIKLLGKHFPFKKDKPVIHDRISNTSNIPFVKWAMEFESKHLPDSKRPFGIRILAVAIKND